MRRDDGFTLVELVIALALVGLVSLLVLGGTRFAAVGLNRTAAATERLESRRTLESLLRRELASALTLPNEPTLAGRPDEIDFLTLAEDGRAGLFQSTIRVESTRGVRSLVLLQRRADGSGAPAERITLVPRLDAFGIAYFGAAGPGADPGWHDRWERMPNLPTLVRFTIDTGDAPAPPPIVIRLWATG